MQPGIRTTRLDLTPAAATDLAYLTAILQDRQVRRFLCDDELLPPEAVADIFGRSRLDAERGLGLWMIRCDGTSIGFAGLRSLDDDDRAAFPPLADCPEVVIGILPAYWGRGFAGEVIDALLCHAFEERGLRAVAGIVDEPNVASRQMLERAGFHEIGRGPGKAFPLVGYELKATQWRPPLRP